MWNDYVKLVYKLNLGWRNACYFIAGNGGVVKVGKSFLWGKQHNTHIFTCLVESCTKEVSVFEMERNVPGIL